MGKYDCYYDADGCWVCPERPASPRVPGYVSKQVVRQWNAGANSIETLDGDVRTNFSLPLGLVGVVVGFKGSRKKQTVPSLIEHGFYFQRQGGVDVLQIIERGSVKSPASPRRDDALKFSIVRRGGDVTYLVNGFHVYASSSPSIGPVVVNACLFASGDTVPLGAPTANAPAPPPDTGDTLLVSGVAQSVTFSTAGTSFTSDPGFYIDVPSGASNATFVLNPPGGDPAEVAMAVNYGTRPTGDYGSAPYDSWSGLTFSGAGNPGEPDFTLSFDAPQPGRWFVVLDASRVSGNQYYLTATVT